MSEISFYGICPAARFGPRPSHLPQDGKDSRTGLSKRARSKQSKAPNSVLIVVWKVLGPTVDELFQ